MVIGTISVSRDHCFPMGISICGYISKPEKVGELNHYIILEEWKVHARTSLDPRSGLLASSPNKDFLEF